MSRAYLSYLANLFDSNEHSDCTIAFCVEVEGPPAAKRPRTRKSTAQCQADAGRKGVEDLPAHLMVVCGGSDHLAELVQEWRDEHPSYPAAGPAAAAVAPRPELPVSLDSAADLPHARAAIRFIYTGKLPRAAAAADLLQIRRQAARLAIKGCVERCDDAVASRAITAAGVMELHACRHLLPPRDEPSTAALLAACRRQLVRNAGAYLANLAHPAPALGELLAWLFPDAPSVLSDPDTRRQMCALPAAALEALLRCDVFATDDEASVLLLLGHWLQANGSATTPETRARLCRLVRLSHLNTAYLHGLLPKIAWFPLCREEHQFVCQYVAESGARRRKSLAAAAAGKHDCSGAWYAAPRRPAARADAGVPYEWSIKLEDLAADLDLATHKIPNGLNGAFANGATRLVAHGFEWYPSAIWFNNDGKPEPVLSCAVPAPFAAFTSAKDVVGVAAATAQLSVFRWRESASGNGDGSVDGGADGGGGSGGGCVPRREAANVKVYGGDEVVSVTSGLAAGAGWRMTVFGKGVEKAPGASSRLLPELLAPYLHSGRLSGSLTFLEA
ncbi:hypothetical protein PLESTB_001793000 [Pleodorina starrii]|uniref:BACK domain-containing protein n=1 Tax=Pleodorina starrii TaxID=330485 RepID=A0A9W6FAD8_9CHLO|nr:hypothetical protein PLESTM_001157200 [Pleodorina starrii]GLC61695.1 hypothetical protein PLESTB_001793000 [Pleodorina starrii]GLC69174.1 hypothetical protein PLESTF_000798600 [Pleodorina starrii]